MKKVYTLFLGVLLMSTSLKLKAQYAQLTNLPTLYITTKDSVTIPDTETWIDGTLNVATGSYDSGYYSGDIEIRGRGNSTWNFPKKPYRIKLAEKYHLLGMPAQEKNWVLLANYADKTLMRNAIAFETSRFFGFDFTVSYRMADVVLNGDYIGTYTVTDQVEAAPDRVNVEEMEEGDTTYPNVTGGYFIETGGATQSDDVHYLTKRGMNMAVKDPDDDDIQPQQVKYIDGAVQKFEDALYSGNFKDPKTGYRKFGDIKTLTDWFLLNDICANSDMCWSMYMYKHRSDQHLYVGPMWDYDIAFNNDNRCGDENYKHMQDFAHPEAGSAVWMQRLVQDEKFYQEVKNRWFQVKQQGLVARLQYVTDSLAGLLKQSQKLNFQRWPILNKIVYLELAARGSFANEVKFLKGFITTHSNWIDSEYVGVDTTQLFTIRNDYAGNYWDVADSSQMASAAIISYPRQNGKLSQQWKFKNLNNGYYKIFNNNSKYVVTTGTNKSLNATLYQTPGSTATDQQWRVINIGDGRYGMINRYTGNAADVSTNQPNVKVLQWYSELYSNIRQQMILTKISKNTLKSDERSSISFTVSPNPANGSNIDIWMMLKTKSNVTVSLIDAQGLQRKATGFGLLGTGTHHLNFSISGLTPGLYTVVVEAEQNVATRSLLIQ